MSLYARFFDVVSGRLEKKKAQCLFELITFTKVRSNHVNFRCLGSYHTYTGLLVSIDATQSGAKIAIPEMCVRCRTLFGGFDRRKEMVEINVS